MERPNSNNGPAGAHYYFGIGVITIGLGKETAEKVLPDGVASLWNIDEVCDAEPMAYHFYRLDYEEVDFFLECYADSIIEVWGTSISFY